MKDFQLPSILPTCYLSLPTQPNFLIRLFTLTVSTSLPPTHSLANFNLSSSPDTPLNHSHQGHRILWTLSSFYPIGPLGNSLCVWSLPRCITASLDFWDTTFSWSSSRLGSLLFLLHLPFWVILFMQVVFVTLSMLSTPKCISLVHVSLLISRWLPFATPPSQLPSRHRIVSLWRSVGHSEVIMSQLSATPLLSLPELMNDNSELLNKNPGSCLWSFS